MALTGDATTQKETFDVPVVARGTFLECGGGHRWSGKEAYRSDSDQRWTGQWMVKGWQGHGVTVD